MALYATAYKISRSNEGGFTIDTGGRTYKGVSEDANPTWPGWKVIAAYEAIHGKLKQDQVINNPALDKMVTDLFKANYWDALKLDNVSSQHVANIMFDFALTSGIKQSAKNAQVVAKVSPDGIIGSDSLKAINSKNEKDYATALLAKNQKFYTDLAKSPTYAKYLKSWTNRIKYFSTIVDKIPGGVAGAGLGIVAFGIGVFFLIRALK